MGAIAKRITAEIGAYSIAPQISGRVCTHRKLPLPQILLAIEQRIPQILPETRDITSRQNKTDAGFREVRRGFVLQSLLLSTFDSSYVLWIVYWLWGRGSQHIQPVWCRSTMDVGRKRVFSVAFGVITDVLNTFRKQQRSQDMDDEELLVMVAQFTALWVGFWWHILISFTKEKPPPSKRKCHLHLGMMTCHRLREDIAKEVGFVETHLAHYTGNQWKEFFHMLPSTAESLLRDIAPFLADAENSENLVGKLFMEAVLGVNVEFINNLCSLHWNMWRALFMESDAVYTPPTPPQFKEHGMFLCRWWSWCCALTQTTTDVFAFCGSWSQVLSRGWQVQCVKIHNVWACFCCVVSVVKWFVVNLCVMAFKTWTERYIWILQGQVQLPRGDWSYWWDTHSDRTPTWQILSSRLFLEPDEKVHDELPDYSCPWPAVFLCWCGSPREGPWRTRVQSFRLMVWKWWENRCFVCVSRLPFGWRCCVSDQKLLAETLQGDR